MDAFFEINPRGYAKRIVLCAFAGSVIAVLLAGFMYMLIQSGDQRLDTEKRFHISDFVRVKRNESTRVKERLPERPVQQEAPKAPQVSNQSAAEADVIAVSDMAINTELSLQSGMRFGTGDGEYLPIVKVAPIYPTRALQANIEGYCVVEYTVTTTGQTKNIVVIEDQCTHKAFFKPSIKAAQKFRYKPRVMDGEAIEVPGVRNRFVYTIQE